MASLVGVGPLPKRDLLSWGPGDQSFGGVRGVRGKGALDLPMVFARGIVLRQDLKHQSRRLLLLLCPAAVDLAVLCECGAGVEAASPGGFSIRVSMLGASNASSEAYPHKLEVFFLLVHGGWRHFWCGREALVLRNARQY